MGKGEIARYAVFKVGHRFFSPENVHSVAQLFLKTRKISWVHS